MIVRVTIEIINIIERMESIGPARFGLSRDAVSNHFPFGLIVINVKTHARENGLGEFR